MLIIQCSNFFQKRFIKDYILDINRLSNSLQKNETHFLRNLFPPVNIEVDEEVNGYLDNIFSIFKGEEESKEVI